MRAFQSLALTRCLSATDWHRYLLAFVGFLGMACVIQNRCNAAEPIEIYKTPLNAPFPRQVRFNLTVENPKGEALTHQTIWLYAPVKKTATQELVKLEVNVPYELEEDAVGNQIIKLKFARFPPYATRLVTIKADLLMSATPRPSELINGGPFLDEERYIEKDDPEIRKTASMIKALHVLDPAAGIFEWVRSNMHYAGYIADDLGARYALLNKRGDCTEYAYLVTALARANRIHSRTLGGYVLDRNDAPKADEYHNWAEMYVHDAWRLVDAQRGIYQADTERYVAMHIISGIFTNALNGAHRFRVDGELNVRLN